MISREPQYLSAAKRYKPLIKAYMNILNVAFQDTTPKYIEKVLVMEVSILFSDLLCKFMHVSLLIEN